MPRLGSPAVAQRAAAPSTNAKERVPCLQLRDKPPVMSAGRKVENQAQEQTQTIATAIGKPAAKAPKIVKVNAESRFASGRTLSNDMSLTPSRG